MTLAPDLSPTEAAIYESLVVGRYMQAFGRSAIPMLIPAQTAIVAHLGCRTGYPADEIARQLQGCTLTGVDVSAAALELARTKATMMSGLHVTYVQGEGLPTPLQSGAFTHTVELHPFGAAGDYSETFAEHQRLLTGQGQMVVSLPLRGSYPEVYDMLREYALRHDQPHFGEAVDSAASSRPNPETIVEQIEAAGFYDVEVGLDLVTIPFDTGRDFLEDPISRLVVGPDIRSSLPNDTGLEEAWEYATEAIGKYWSEIRFELTVNIGSISARRVP